MRAFPLALSLLLICPAAPAAPPAGFQARVEQLRAGVGVPGMAVAIVERGRPTLVQGFGVRQLRRPEPVDHDTLFPTGSTGKAFTSAALALLVDQGRLKWDDRVIDHLPWFRMYDPYVTREMTVRDLLVHRSGLGLGAGDLLYVPRGSLSRREAVKRLAFIKPAGGFRDRYAYDNILYMVAGQLIEEVTGESWESFVRDRLLKPAGMTVSTTEPDARRATPNRAFPHARLGKVRGEGPLSLLDERDDLGKAAAPAGAMALSAHDMARWLQIQLAQGALPEGGRLFSAEAAREMWTPVVLEPIAEPPPLLKGTEPLFSSYALGWEVRDYRGAKIVWHSGGVFGFVCAVVLIPEKEVGFAILLNSEDGQLVRGLMFELMDHYLDAPRQDWPAKWSAYAKARIENGLKLLQTAQAKPARVGPSLPLPRYAGTYADPWYGRLVVGSDSGGLTVDFATTPGMTGRLRHFQYDSFVTEFADRAIEPAYVTFQLDADGKVDRITLKPVSPLADFSYDYQDLLFRPAAAR
jgi:CubicO group peptidase (beta-lactamase class C family)